MSMIIQTTNAGTALIAAATGPIVVTSYKFGSQFGYVPTLEQADILGTQIRTGAPSAPIVEDGNTMRYSILLPADLGPLTFGEIGLFVGPVLFAVGVFDLPITKLPTNMETDTGGHMVIDFHIPMANPNYAMWADVTQANVYKLNVVNGPHLIPKARGANPNLMMIQGASTTKPGFLAYSDRDDIWEFDKYQRQGELTVVSASASAIRVSIESAEAVVGPNGDFTDGDVLVQFSSGFLQGIVRYCSRAILSGGLTQLTLSVPAAQAPVVGDKVIIYKPFTVPASTGGGGGPTIQLTRDADYPSTSDSTATTPLYVSNLLADLDDAFDDLPAAS